MDTRMANPEETIPAKTGEVGGGIVTADYTSESIQVLEGLEAIRKRPGMYVGGTGPNALHHLVYECVDNSIDEAMAGHATAVTVRIDVDGSCEVIDDGRGMPVDPMRHENPAINGRPAIEVILTEVHAGGKFGDNAYKVSGGLHGVGVKCVNALSEWTRVEVLRDGQIHEISFERGKVTHPLALVGPVPPNATRTTGTSIRFLPDREIFPDTSFIYDTLAWRLRELAYLNAGVRIRLIDERVDRSGNRHEDEFHDHDGLAAYVRHLNTAKDVQGPVISFFGEDAESGVRVDIAMQYTDAPAENILCFGNNIRNGDGGTHFAGFRSALTRVVNGYAKENGLLKDLVPTGEDLREGLTAVISVKLPNPQFNNQTKEKLLNPEIEGFVSQTVGERLKAWLEENPREARDICNRAVLAAQAREAARKARELIKRKGSLESGGMPHKLADCSSNDVEKTELFIVEGDSAGGSAKGGRDHVTQAILPLRGKLLNVEKARLDKVLGFEEIRILIQALQCGIGEDFDLARLRYGRVVIMTDADVDGSHIRTLLLTFFFRQMPELVRRGKIYIAQPPLYQVMKGKRSQYVLNDRSMGEALVEMALAHAKLAIRDETGAVARTLEGGEVRRLVQSLNRLDELVGVTQRRGIPFQRLLDARAVDPEGSGRLPSWHVVWPGGDGFFWSEADARNHIAAKNLLLDEMGGAVGAADRLRLASLRELHENRELERLFRDLAAAGLSVEHWSLVQEESVTGEKRPTRYAWLVEGRGRAKAAGTAEAGGEEDGEVPEGEDAAKAAPRVEPVECPNIPSILKQLHEVGRRGIEVKRFKGLGEMDAEQLWETTMNPANRTLLRVTWDSASEADQLFTILMGENVEARRAYIEKHAVEVKNLDV